MEALGEREREGGGLQITLSINLRETGEKELGNRMDKRCYRFFLVALIKIKVG